MGASIWWKDNVQVFIRFSEVTVFKVSGQHLHLSSFMAVRRDEKITRAPRSQVPLLSLPPTHILLGMPRTATSWR